MDHEDYALFDRKDGSSFKYAYTLAIQPEVNPDNALIVSYADMEFRLSPKILAKLNENIGQTPFGYSALKPSVWQALENWVRSRYYSEMVVNSSTTLIWHSLLQAYNAALEIYTAPGDGVLFLNPSYYRLMVQAEHLQRKCFEVELQTKHNRLHIDFEAVDKAIEENHIKLLAFINPHNPCGRIWSKEELTQLKDILIKHKCYVFSDEIYSDAVEGETFTSLLAFEDLHPYLIYANSYTKTFNCSGMPLCYSFVFDPEKEKKLRVHADLAMVSMPSTVCIALLETLYASKEAAEWRLNTIQYISQNYQLFKELCAKMLSKLYIYELEASYLCLVDFKEYGLAGEELKAAFDKVDVCPALMGNFFIEKKPRSLVRLNLACNKAVIEELVGRMAKMIE